VNGDLLADSNNAVNRWKSYFSQLLDVHNVSDVRQIEIHTAEPLLPGPSHLEVDITIARLKKYKSQGSDQIPAQVIGAGCEIIVSVINSLTTSSLRSNSIVQVHKKGERTDCNNYRAISLLPTSYKILSNILLSRLSSYIDENFRDHQCGFRRNRSTNLLTPRPLVCERTTDQIFCIRQILEKKNGITMRRCVSYS
jgi:hypothetical protein